MVNKKYRNVIGDTDNKYEYLDENPMCECCHEQSGNVHHHIYQQFTFRGIGYIFELKINYSTLCIRCHGIIEYNESQYYRQLYGKENKFISGHVNLIKWDYWKTMKEGHEPTDFIEGVEV